MYENAFRWPKMLLRRVGLNGTEDVRLYLVQEMDGLRREFLAIGGASLADENSARYATAIDVLKELGMKVPAVLVEKYQENLDTEAQRITAKEMDRREISREKRKRKKALNMPEIEEYREKLHVAPSKK